RLQVADTAQHEEPDDALRLRLEMRLPIGRLPRLAADDAVTEEHRTEGETGEAKPEIRQESSSVHMRPPENATKRNSHKKHERHKKSKEGGPTPGARPRHRRGDSPHPARLTGCGRHFGHEVLLHGEPWRAEVDQQASLDAGRLQVAQDLGNVLVRDEPD